MYSQEYDKLREVQNVLHKRLRQLRKIAKAKNRILIANEAQAKIEAIEKEMIENQELLNNLKKKKKRERSKIMRAYTKATKADDVAKSKQDKSTHAISKFNDIKATFVQGGAPSLGKGKS